MLASMCGLLYVLQFHYITSYNKISSQRKNTERKKELKKCFHQDHISTEETFLLLYPYLRIYCYYLIPKNVSTENSPSLTMSLHMDQ